MKLLLLTDVAIIAFKASNIKPSDLIYALLQYVFAVKIFDLVFFFTLIQFILRSFSQPLDYFIKTGFFDLIYDKP